MSNIVEMRPEKYKQGLKDMVDFIYDVCHVKPDYKLTILEVGSYAGDSAETFC